MNERAAAAGSPTRTAAKEESADQDFSLGRNSNGLLRQNRYAASIDLLRKLVYLHLKGDERRDAIECLRLAEQLTVPPREIVYGHFAALAERRRRALTPRPGDFPGFGVQ
jgi:hypothetical protein